MLEQRKAANLCRCDCGSPAEAWLALEKWKNAVSLCKSSMYALHMRRIYRVVFDRTWHINWGITRWKDDPLKDKGFPDGPFPFSPTSQKLVQ